MRIACSSKFIGFGSKLRRSKPTWFTITIIRNSIEQQFFDEKILIQNWMDKQLFLPSDDTHVFHNLLLSDVSEKFISIKWLIFNFYAKSVELLRVWMFMSVVTGRKFACVCLCTKRNTVTRERDLFIGIIVCSCSSYEIYLMTTKWHLQDVYHLMTVMPLRFFCRICMLIGRTTTDAKTRFLRCIFCFFLSFLNDIKRPSSHPVPNWIWQIQSDTVEERNTRSEENNFNGIKWQITLQVFDEMNRRFWIHRPKNERRSFCM